MRAEERPHPLGVRPFYGEMIWRVDDARFGVGMPRRMRGGFRWASGGRAMRVWPSVKGKTVEGESSETALKLKAMPATREMVRRGVGRQQVSPDDLMAVERLGVIFFPFFRAHGEESRGDDHRKKNAGKNEIVDHLGGCSFVRAALAVSMKQSSAWGAGADIALWRLGMTRRL